MRFITITLIVHAPDPPGDTARDPVTVSPVAATG
jgi:hypothetical protein